MYVIYILQTIFITSLFLSFSLCSLFNCVPVIPRGTKTAVCWKGRAVMCDSALRLTRGDKKCYPIVLCTYVLHVPIKLLYHLIFLCSDGTPRSLTHCDQVTPHGDIDLNQYGIRFGWSWLVIREVQWTILVVFVAFRHCQVDDLLQERRNSNGMEISNEIHQP